MVLPCEVAVRSLVPAIRSTIARELTHSYGLRQKDVANLLGVTQTAVSKYSRGVRGGVIEVREVEEVQPKIEEIVASLANGTMSKYELVQEICAVCETVRRIGLMCELCRFSDPSIDVKKCFVCQGV